MRIKSYVYIMFHGARINFYFPVNSVYAALH